MSAGIYKVTMSSSSGTWLWNDCCRPWWCGTQRSRGQQTPWTHPSQHWKSYHQGWCSSFHRLHGSFRCGAAVFTHWLVVVLLHRLHGNLLVVLRFHGNLLVVLRFHGCARSLGRLRSCHGQKISRGRTMGTGVNCLRLESPLERKLHRFSVLVQPPTTFCETQTDWKQLQWNVNKCKKCKYL